VADLNSASLSAQARDATAQPIFTRSFRDKYSPNEALESGYELGQPLTSVIIVYLISSAENAHVHAHHETQEK
jgi:hypothetical protein